MTAANPKSRMAALRNTIAIGVVVCEWSAVLWGRTSASARSFHQATCSTGIWAGTLQLQNFIDALCIAAR